MEGPPEVAIVAKVLYVFGCRAPAPVAKQHFVYTIGAGESRVYANLVW